MALRAPLTFTQLGCSLAICGKHFQFGVKRGHISRTSCNWWRHHTTHPFVRTFYAFESPLSYNHQNHEGDVIVIPFAMGLSK
jgi:hypothetical protein